MGSGPRPPEESPGNTVRDGSEADAAIVPSSLGPAHAISMVPASPGLAL